MGTEEVEIQVSPESVVLAEEREKALRYWKNTLDEIMGDGGDASFQNILSQPEEIKSWFKKGKSGKLPLMYDIEMNLWRKKMLKLGDAVQKILDLEEDAGLRKFVLDFEDLKKTNSWWVFKDFKSDMAKILNNLAKAVVTECGDDTTSAKYQRIFKEKMLLLKTEINLHRPKIYSVVGGEEKGKEVMTEIVKGPLTTILTERLALWKRLASQGK